MSTQITLSQAFNHHHALNKQKDQPATVDASSHNSTNTSNYNDRSSLSSATSRHCTPKVSAASLKSIESATATLRFSSSIEESLPPDIDLILIKRARQKKNKRYLIKNSKSSSHLNKELPPLPPSEFSIQFNPPNHIFDNHSIKTTSSEPVVSSSATKVVHERYHSETSTAGASSTSDKCSVHTVKLAQCSSNFSLQDLNAATTTTKTIDRSRSGSLLKTAFSSSATPTLHSYSSFSSLQSMENTTNYSIDTNSTTCHSLPEAAFKSVNNNITNNNTSSSNKVALLDAKVSSIQPAKFDKPQYIQHQQLNQYQKSQQKQNVPQQHNQCPQKYLAIGHSTAFVDDEFNLNSEPSQIPRQYQVAHAPHGDQSKSFNYNNDNNNTIPYSRLGNSQYDQSPTEFKYPSSTPLVQQRAPPGMQKRWSRSGTDHTNPIRNNTMYHQPKININDPKVQKRLRTKYNLIRELVETEETFNLDLSIVSDVYANSLINPPYLHYTSGRDVTALFSNVEQILLLSRRFVSHLKECIPAYILYGCELKDSEILKDVRSNIGEVILEYIPNLEAAYRIYCKQSQFQLNTFYRLDTMGPPMIQNWLRECRELSKDFTQAWTLDALLIKPVQRLMKYPLLLTSLLEVTTNDHPDYPALKQSLENMQETANKIDALEPDNIYVYQRKTDSVYDENDSYDDYGAILSKVDYNTAMSRLKDDPRIDEELELLIIQFDRKQRHVKNLIKSLRETIQQIQNHFDANSSFAHAWSAWGADDNKRGKIYKKFALFALPFTTSSSAHVSTNNLLDLIEAKVLSPLQKMYEYYHQASNTILLHDRTHTAYQRYTEWRTLDEHPHSQSELSAEVLTDANTFVRAHNLLKIELPELFSNTEHIIDASLVRFLSIQRDWFRVAVDSTSNVFGLTLNDIRATKKDPIIDTFKRHQSHVARSTVDKKLQICHTLESAASSGFDTPTLVEPLQSQQQFQYKEYQVHKPAHQRPQAQQAPRQHLATNVNGLQLTAISSPSSVSSASQDSESMGSAATTPTTPQHKRRSLVLNWPIRKNTIRKNFD